MAVNGTAANGDNSAASASATEINEDLYSRQLYTVGRQAMQKMRHTKVLISGMGGLGVEIAKNVILAGVRAVTVHDVSPAAMGDLAAQYYLTEADIGMNRAEACYGKLAELNSEVEVSCFTGPLSTAYIAQQHFHVVVLTDTTTDQVAAIDDFCHEKDIKFIAASTAGLFGMLFNDFGKSFEIVDTTGEEPLSAIVASISNDSEGRVLCLEESRHGFEDGDWVKFSEVEGMTEINGKEFKITVTSPHEFKVGDLSGFSQYTTKGIAVQVKKPKLMSFKKYTDAAKDTEIIIADYAKFESPRQVHIAFQALSEFKKREKRGPGPRSASDSKLFLEDCKKIAGSDVEVDEKLMETFSFTCDGQICPINGVLGGVVAQEVMKSCTGKFSPIYQWFYFDAIECLPTDCSALSEKECSPIGSRYDGQIKIFGKSAQKKLNDMNSFIVGAGAIGCEHLKNFAMMGVSCGGGSLTITDMDIIETSNLNRQFLFRKENVKSEKSVCAAKAAKGFNPDLNIKAKFEKVCPETENIFDDEFFEKLDFVANALDNVDARLYMDRRCIYYRKPLLESGTQGSKGNTQMVIPHLTESYGSTRDPPEKSFPICTLKSFPYEIAHCLQWAREEFESMFSTPFVFAGQLSEVADKPDELAKLFDKLKAAPNSQAKETLVPLKRLLEDKPTNFAECVKWARDCWLDRYHNQIAQLLFAFPEDRKTSTGAPFWSPPKRCPKVLELDPSDLYHIEYIAAAALLRAGNFNLKSPEDIQASKKNYETTLDEVRRILEGLEKPPVFVPREGVRIAENDSQLEALESESDQEVDTLVSDVEALIRSSAAGAGASLQLKPVDFEKDDELNWHIEFITASSNNRATNYFIELADKFKSKQIAGKIIPAIATTTAVVSGLVGLELYKVLNKEDNIEKFRSAFINLALPYFGLSEPLPPAKKTYNEKEWTLWDRLDFSYQDIPNIKALKEWFKVNEKMDLQMVTYNVSMLYTYFMPPAKQQLRESQSIQAVIEEVIKAPIAPEKKYVVLEVICEQDEEDDVDLPYINYRIR